MASLDYLKANPLRLVTCVGLNEVVGHYYYEGRNMYSEGMELALKGSLLEKIQFILGGIK